MSQIIVADRVDAEHVIEARTEGSVMEAIRDAGFQDEFGLCGGNCSCATCHIYVEESFLGLLSGMSADEDDLLSSSGHRRHNSRLSCQLPAAETLDGVRVAIAPAD